MARQRSSIWIVPAESWSTQGDLLLSISIWVQTAEQIPSIGRPFVNMRESIKPNAACGRITGHSEVIVLFQCPIAAPLSRKRLRTGAEHARVDNPKNTAGDKLSPQRSLGQFD